MASPLPVTRGDSVALYPFSRTIKTFTRVHAFENGNEQRFVVAPPRVEFSLPFDHMAGNLIQALRGAHASAKGQLDTTLSLILGSITYTNLTFLDDAFESVEYLNGVYRTEIRLRQTIPQLLTADANGNVFPSSLGLYPHLPYSRSTRSKTYVGDQETGPRFGCGMYGTGLTGFPTRQLFGFKIQADMMSDADRDTLESFFIAMNGWYGKFSYTDAEDGTGYPCCIAQHDLAIEYIQPDVNRVSVAIEEKPN